MTSSESEDAGGGNPHSNSHHLKRHGEVSERM